MGEDKVTIDSIVIELDSESTNAVKGIDALAGSLEKLKKSGSFKTAITNLNNLSTALKNLPNVHSASNSLRTLANSIEKLKGVGSVASLSNSLAKLPAALKSVSSIDLDRVAPQLQKVADTVAPLSNIKAGGLNTMVNSLKKLGDVTDSLDDDTIARFAQKIGVLNEKLAPLSEKMTSIKAGFSAINTNARKASESVEDFSGGIDSGALNMSSFIDIGRSIIDTFQTVRDVFVKITEQAIEWDGIAARFGRGFAGSASETYAWIQRLNEEMGINIQEFMKYSSVYSTMLTGFGVATEDAGKMALGYMELTYDIWAGYNDVYGSLEETAEAVKSAIAGEVEPVRRAGFTIVESTLKQTAANHGLEISLENATEAQKSYLRYLTLIDQAHAQGLVGTYAKELNTAEGLMRTFAQQTKSLAQAFGSLFLPILVKVMPWFQAFVELLTEGVYWLANFFGIDIQPVDFSGYEAGSGAIDNVTDSAGSATGALNDATKAAKELKNATLGIDELNVISPSSASSGGAGGSGAGGAGGNGFAGLDVGSLWDETIFDTIQSDVDAIKEKLKGWLPVIATVSTALAGLRLVKLIGDMEKIKNLKIASYFTDMGSGITAFFKAAKQNAPEVGWFAALFPKLSTWLAGLPAALSSAATFLSAAAPYIAIAAAVVAGITLAFVEYDFTDIGYKVGEKVGSALKAGWEFIRDGFIAAWEWAVDALDIDDFWDVLAILFIPGEWIRRITPEITEIFNKVSDWINDKIENLKGNINEFFGGFFDGLFDGLGIDMSWADKFVEIFDIEYLDIVDAIMTVMNPQKIGSDIIGGLIEGIKSGNLFESIKTKFTDFVDKVKEFFGINSPSTLMRDKIGKYLIPGITSGMSLNGIKDRLSSVWNTAKSWWDSKKPSLKSYTPSIGSIYDKLKPRWDNARTWWNEKKSAMKTYTPSIGSIYEKVYDRWKNARDWWNGKKGSFKTYTPSIGSITDKLKSAWNSAKSWWNKNVKLSTKLNISVPTIKVKWDTASAFGKSFKYPTGFSLKFAADGGIFDAGSLIWAGERGAEIVANAGGGKTGVMNVQQMQDAVFEGVYAAMSAAMRGNGSGGSSQVIKVYLDGKEITSTVEKTQRERGSSIMGNEVYAY